jgi:hypothetical protein
MWILYGLAAYFGLVAIYGAGYVPTRERGSTTHGIEDHSMWVFASICFAICAGLILVLR